MNIDSMDAKQPERLPIVIEGQTFKPNSEGLWSLTEINKALPGLTKPPAQWRGRERDYFERCANLHIVHGDQGGTWATERATIAYAMTCSLDFYVMVVDAFLTMRNDALLSVRMASLALVEKDQLLADNMPKADTLIRKAAAYGVSWTDACRASNILHPGLAKDYLLAINKFQKVFDNDRGIYTTRPISLGFQKGYFKRHTGRYGTDDGWKVSNTGLVWLAGKAAEINQATSEMKRQSVKRRNATKRLTSGVRC